MSGMTLMPTFPGSEFKGPDVEDESGQLDGRRVVDSGDSVHSVRSSNASPIPSAHKGGISRPPGLAGISLPSPVGKLGHSYASTGSTAQNMTLTPTSSVDGGDIHARQSSPFHSDGPSMSSDYSRRGFDESELPPGISNLASFDAEDAEHDGLLGLQALRERSHSVPGMVSPYSSSSSPPVRAQIGGNLDDGRQGVRPRAISRDSGRSQSASSRPPLAGASQHHSELKVYQSGYSSSGSRSRDHSPTPPGIISRPSNQQFDAPPERLYDLPRGRSTGSESGHSYQYGDRNQTSVDQLAHKFGQLNSNPYSNPQSNAGYNRAQRSSSLPGPMRGVPGQSDHYPEDPPHMRRGSDYGVGMSVNSHSHSDRDYHSQHVGHDSHGSPPMINQRRSSLQNFPASNTGFYGHPHNVHRRESLDFVPGHNRYPEGVPVVATNEEMRVYAGSDGSVGSYRHASPAQSPMHTRYGGNHNRHPSDMGSSALSSSPMSHSSSMGGVHGHGMYDAQSRGRHYVNADDDLSHPLIGEHIDVPADDRGYEQHMQQPRGARPGQGHSLPHYGGAAAAHVMPAGGSALQAPKIVYGVKFKRTQRTFALGPRLNRDLKVGTYVKVEADRGEDLGIVVGRVPPEKVASGRSNFRGEMGGAPPSGFPPSGGADLKRIIRLATHDEVGLLQMKKEEEDELLKICRTKVRQRNLNMNVVDAEYQFDRHKLTFFFEAEGRVDFRELVRDLFSMYKTRIWMQQLDKTSSSTCPTAAEEPQAVAMDYGTPIIAPVSEYSEFAGSDKNN